MNTVYEFGDNRKTAMPSDDLIDVDIEDYMGGEQGPDPDSQSGHAESDLPDEVPADDDNAGNTPAFSETGWDDDEDGVTTMSSRRQPRRRATRKTASGYYDHGGGVVELGVYGGDNQVGNAYGRIFAKQNADGTFDVVEVAYFAAVNSVMDDEADELIAANEVFVEEQTWEWKGVSNPERTDGESPDDITYRNDLLWRNVSLAEAERLAEEYARSLSARGDHIASRKRAEVDYTKQEVQPGSRAADVAGTPTPGKSVADYPQPQNVQHETAAEGWPVGEMTHAEAARLRKFRNAVKKNVRSGKVAFEYPEELGVTEDGITVSRYRASGTIELTYIDDADQYESMRYMDYTIDEAIDRFREQFGLPTPAGEPYITMMFGASRRSPARRASRKRALQETQCSQCGKWSQSQFPGGLCLECWEKSPESQRMVSAEELVSMWGGPTRRRGSRKTAMALDWTRRSGENASKYYFATHSENGVHAGIEIEPYEGKYYWSVLIYPSNNGGYYKNWAVYSGGDASSLPEAKEDAAMSMMRAIGEGEEGLFQRLKAEENARHREEMASYRRGSRRTAERYPDVYVQLSGEDGNAFGIIGRVQKELRRAGATPEELKEFMDEATSGDYDHLLQTVMRWVKVGSRGSRRSRRAVRKTADLDVRMMLTSDLGFAVREFVRDEMSDGMSETQYKKAMWDFALTQATSNEDAIKRAQVVLNDLVHGGYDNANDVQAELYEYLQENGIDDEWDRLQREWKAYLRQARTGSRKVARRPFVGSRGGRPRRGVTKRASSQEQVFDLSDRVEDLGRRLEDAGVHNSAYLLMIEGRVWEKVQRALRGMNFAYGAFPYSLRDAVEHVFTLHNSGFNDYSVELSDVMQVVEHSVATMERNFDQIVQDAKAERTDAWSTMGSRKRGSRDSYDAGFAKGVEDAENRMPQLEFTIDADPDWVSGYYDAYETYGFDKLPDDFDSWNSVDKDEYLNDLRLRGYGSRKRSKRNH